MLPAQGDIQSRLVNHSNKDVNPPFEDHNQQHQQQKHFNKGPAPQLNQLANSQNLKYQASQQYLPQFQKQQQQPQCEKEDTNRGTKGKRENSKSRKQAEKKAKYKEKRRGIYFITFFSS